MSTVESWLEVQLQRIGEKVEDIELAEQGRQALAMVTALAHRAEQIRSLRADKGKGAILGHRSREVINELGRQAARLERN